MKTFDDNILKNIYIIIQKTPALLIFILFTVYTLVYKECVTKHKQVMNNGKLKFYAFSKLPCLLHNTHMIMNLNLKTNKRFMK